MLLTVHRTRGRAARTPGLLSAYVVLYFRSSTGARLALFLALLIGVMGLNEVPRIRRAGYDLRLGLYGFCVLSFLIYFFPIVLGRIEGWVFLLSLLSSAAVVWQVTRWLAPASPKPSPEPWRRRGEGGARSEESRAGRERRVRGGGQP